MDNTIKKIKKHCYTLDFLKVSSGNKKSIFKDENIKIYCLNK